MLAGLLNSIYSQALNIGFKTEKDCNTDVFYTTIQLYLDTTSTMQIGNSSILFSFNSDAIIYKDYQALHFNGSDYCAGAGATSWDVHKVDEVSFSDQFHLLLSLLDTNFSCPSISNLDTIDIGIISFDIIQQGANPFIYVDTTMTWFNSDIPNSGAAMITLGYIAFIDSAGVLLCDCPGEGQPCDDNNVLTVNDEYNNYCICEGEYLDSDQDGILDGIDPCMDIVYEAEDAYLGDVAIGNTYFQHTGTGYINFLNYTGDSIEFTISPPDSGFYYMYFKYSLESGNRPLEFSIDGVVINSSLDFPSTGDWNDWDTISFANNFTPGNHTVLFVTIGSEGPMFDHLRLSICTGCNTAGNACNDGDTCTVNDVIDANCNCNGIYLDTDNDDVCNEFDICEGGIDSLDIDFDGIPDYCDNCNDLIIGTACDDGNPCTYNDTLNANCMCEGVWAYADSDGDGVCDILDFCPGGDDNIDEDNDGIPDYCDLCNGLLIGIPCNDGDTCTVLDAYDMDCNCIGIYLDSDGDGVCNTLDQCEGSADSLDIDLDGIPDDCDDCDNLTTGTSCDDEDDCTVNDTIDAYCECVGEYIDSDLDGVCDALDQCPGYIDGEDNDGDAIPNSCDNCYDLVYQAENMYFSSSAIYGVGGNASGSGYVRFTNNIDTIIFNVMAGDTGVTTVTIRYSQDEDGKTGMIKFDGQVLFEDFGYPKVNDDWQHWDTVQFVVYFTEGNHTIELINNDQSPYGPRIDYISLCTPGYIPEPLIAKGNNQFEDGFENWTRLYNWENGYSNIFIDTSYAFCGYNDAYFGSSNEYQQLHTTLEHLLIGDTMHLHFNSTSGMANVWVGPSSTSVFSGSYKFVNTLWAQGDYVHDSIEFIVTEPTMVVMFDILLYNEFYLDNLSFNGYGCEPEIVLDISGISCFGDSNAEITANCIGGANPIEYIWSTGDTIQTISNLAEGTYSLIITDKYGAADFLSYDIFAPEKLQVLSNLIHESDIGVNDGSILVNVFGGVSPYNYIWSTGDSINALDNLSSGLYTLTLSDDNDCLLDTTYEISTISLFNSSNWNYNITANSHIFLFQPTSQIIIDSVPMENGDYIGAFYDSLGVEVCAGYMMWLSTTGYVPVFGNDSYTNDIEGFTAGEEIMWRVWKSSDSTLINVVAEYITNIPSIPDSGYFVANGMSGVLSLHGEISIQTQSIIMHENWDIYSSNLDIEIPDISIVFNDIVINVVIVKNTDGYVYWPAFGFNDIGDMIIGQGYQIKMSQVDTLIVLGFPIVPQQTMLSIPEGWSLIGYLRSTPAPITDMFNTIVSHIVIVKDGFGNIFWPSFSVNTIGNMYPGKGYLINLLSPQTFAYPSNTFQISKSFKEKAKPVFYKPKHLGINNMTIGIPLNICQQYLQIGDEIGVFSENGALVGSSVFEGENTAITLWGNDVYSDGKYNLNEGDSFVIKVWYHKSNIQEEWSVVNQVAIGWLEGDNTFENNKIAIVGSISSSIFNKNEIMLSQNIPNPFKYETEISFYLPQSINVEISVLNLLGETISVLYSGIKDEGFHEIKFRTDNIAAGSYYYQLKTNDLSRVKKMIILGDK